jgi:predicted DNA-binding WGR domain protein
MKINARQHITKKGIIKKNPVINGGWNVFINTEEGHNKFWSYNINTGEVHWGRIGGSGESSFFDTNTIMKRREEKLGKGYREYGTGLSSPFPR